MDIKQRVLLTSSVGLVCKLRALQSLLVVGNCYVVTWQGKASRSCSVENHEHLGPWPLPSSSPPGHFPSQGWA